MGTKVYDNYADLITFNRNSKGTALRPIGYGDELVTNGTFDTDVSGWTSWGSIISYDSSNNALRIDGNGFAFCGAYQGVSTEVGKVYALTMDIIDLQSGGSSGFRVGSSYGGQNDVLDVNAPVNYLGQFKALFRATSTVSYVLARSSPTTSGYAVVDNISVKEVLFDREGDPLTLFLHPEGVPRIEYDADRNLKGLLIEPESTNQVRNGSATGSTTGVIGSGGVYPTNWTAPSVTPGISVEVIGTGTEIGVSYIDLKFSGTATATTQTRLAFESGTQIVAAPSEVWTTSFFAKTIDLTAAYDSVAVQQVYRNGAGGLIGADADQKTLTSSLARYSETGTTTALTGYIVPEIVFGFTNAQAYDFTVRIGWVQCEGSPIATSPMPTTGSPFTRGKDEATMTNVSGLIGQKEGTFYMEVDFRTATGAYQHILNVNDGTPANRILIWVFGGNTLMYIDSNGSLVLNTGASSLSNGVQKLAFAYANGDQEFYRNGSSIGTGTGSLTSLPTLTDIDLLQSPGAIRQPNMWIRAVALFTRRLSDAECIALTTL